MVSKISPVRMLPSPGELLLPSKFDKWREGQASAILAFLRSKKDVFMLDAPTGSGKTLTAAALQRIIDVHVVYSCTTRGLQQQFLEDFPYSKVLMGRGNYPCIARKNLFPDVTAEDCKHTNGEHCELLSDCAYLVAKQQALAADIAVVNSSYLLAETNYVGGLTSEGKNPIPLLVLDEGDCIEDQLMNFVNVLITKRQLDYLGLEPPKYKTKFEAWLDWARSAKLQVDNEVSRLEKQRDNAWQTVDFKSLRRLRALNRLSSKLGFFISEVDDLWVWNSSPERWEFKPVLVGKYAGRLLWQHAKKVLAMSATILDPIQMARNIGLESKKASYLALDSAFPAENRPIEYLPAADVSRKNLSVALPKLAKAVQKILDNHKDDKILCHTVTYDTQQYLLNHLSSHTRLVTHSPGTTITQLEHFKKAAQPLVMLSPSMARGIDLPYDSCRVVIICKVPYPYLGDKQVSQRVYRIKDGQSWYSHRTVSTLIQMCGRGVRAEDDWAKTYILDENFERLYSSNKRLFPPWWRDALKEDSTM